MTRLRKAATARREALCSVLFTAVAFPAGVAHVAAAGIEHRHPLSVGDAGRTDRVALLRIPPVAAIGHELATGFSGMIAQPFTQKEQP